MDHRSKKTLIIIIIISISTILATIYTSYLEPNNSHLVFGATYMTMNNPFYEVINNELKKTIEKRGDELITRNPELNINKQKQQIKSFIKKKVNGIFINPIESDKISDVLKEAKVAGIPVIAIDASVTDTSLLDCTIESDNYHAGELCANNMMSRFSSANIILLQHSTVESAVTRIKGFIDTITNNSQYKIVDQLECEGQLEIAMPMVKESLKKHSNVNVIMALNDPSALGALAAIESMHKQDIIVYGVDGTPDLKSLIKDNANIGGTAAQSPIQFGKIAAREMYRVLNNKHVPDKIEVPVTFISQENIDSFNVKGWQ